MAVIRAELAAIAEGPRGLLLTGEPGIGKSRLIDETIALALRAHPDAVVLRGRCLDERGVPPFLPWVDALRTPPERPPVDRALHALGRRLAGDVDTRAMPAGVLSAEQQRFRLYDAATLALARCALKQPVVLAFDDLQWSDIASNTLLRYVMTRLPTCPLLVIAAAREDELSPSHPFSRTIDDLGRRRLLRAITVRPLDRSAVAALIAELLTAPPEPSLVDAILDRYGGNPFCIEEAVAALLDGAGPSQPATSAAPWAESWPLPRGVAAITLRRLERLSPAARALLEAAALVGRGFATRIVAAAEGLHRDAADDLLADAKRAGLIGVASDEEDIAIDFRFSHDRVRESIASAIDPLRCRRLHARIADAIEADGRLDDLPRLAALAHHRRRARQFEAAAALAIRLGDCAMRAHAPRDAMAAYQMALDLSPAGAPTVGGIVRAAALLRLGDAALAAGDAGAVDALLTAEAASLAAGDDRGVARARRRLGAAHARREAFALAVACLESGRALLERLIAAGSGDPDLEIELAGVLVELAEIEGVSLGHYDAAIACGERALDLADRHANHAPAHAARARLAQANTLLRSGNLPAGEALLPLASAGALAAGNGALAAAVYGAEANLRYWLGDLDGSERATAQRTRLAIESGDSWALRHAASWQALLDCSRGRWQAAERALDDAARLVERLDSAEPGAFLRQIRGFSLLLRGRHAEAAAMLEAAMAGFRASGPGTLVWYLGCLAAAHAAAGDTEGAERVAREVRALIADIPAGALPTAPALAELALLAATTGDRAEARRLYPALAPFAGQLHWVLIDRARGMLAATMGDFGRAERHFQAAIALAERNGIAPELALTLGASGMALRQAGGRADRTVADGRLRRALHAFRRLDMAADADRVAALLDGAGQTPEAWPGMGDLSAREVDVLALVVEGCTNRAIAQRLSISEKTVANHLTHIFTKIGVENRAAAVAVALRRSLV